MFICKDCGETFWEMPTERVRIGVGDFGFGSVGFYEDQKLNCDCGGEIVEATECENCGEWIPEGEYLCKDCEAELEEEEAV